MYLYAFCFSGQAVELFSQTGATIRELNLLRQCLSKVKAGKLGAKVLPAQVLMFVYH